MPILRSEVLRLPAYGSACIIDKDVETSKSLDGAPDRLLAGGLVENIQFHKLGGGAERAPLVVGTGACSKGDPERLGMAGEVGTGC